MFSSEPIDIPKTPKALSKRLVFGPISGSSTHFIQEHAEKPRQTIPIWEQYCSTCENPLYSEEEGKSRCSFNGYVCEGCVYKWSNDNTGNNPRKIFLRWKDYDPHSNSDSEEE